MEDNTSSVNNNANSYLSGIMNRCYSTMSVIMEIKMKKVIIVIMTMLGLMGCVPETVKKQSIFELSKEHFKNTLTIADDSLDIIATFSTENGYMDGEDNNNITAERGWVIQVENCLRGFINKKDGHRSYQVYNYVSYLGPWKFFETANYETSKGPVSVPLSILKRDVYYDKGVVQAETVTFDIDEDLLRNIAKTYSSVPTEKSAWRYKLISRVPPDCYFVITPAEVAGLLEKMDEYQKDISQIPQ